MLRGLVGMLLLANLALYAWTQGWLGARGGEAGEPDRLSRQMRPDAVRVLTEAEAASVSAASPVACWQSGPLTAAAFAATTAALAAASVPRQAWQDEAVDRPGAWIVYMGRYAGREAMARKQEELARIHLSAEPADAASGVPAELVPGLVLGRFDRRGAAEEALAQDAVRGLHTARVVELRPDMTWHTVRLDRWPLADAARLDTLRSDNGSPRFVRCAAG